MLVEQAGNGLPRVRKVVGLKCKDRGGMVYALLQDLKVGRDASFGKRGGFQDAGQIINVSLIPILPGPKFVLPRPHHGKKPRIESCGCDLFRKTVLGRCAEARGQAQADRMLYLPLALAGKLSEPSARVMHHGSGRRKLGFYDYRRFSVQQNVGASSLIEQAILFGHEDIFMHPSGILPAQNIGEYGIDVLFAVIGHGNGLSQWRGAKVNVNYGQDRVSERRQPREIPRAAIVGPEECHRS